MLLNTDATAERNGFLKSAATRYGGAVLFQLWVNFGFALKFQNDSLFSHHRSNTSSTYDEDYKEEKK
jgi:hypothetical protein